MLKRNLVANYLGQGWVALMGLAFIPLYVRYLGIEAYGLIGLFAVLQSLLVILDLGMTPTLSREMARFTGGGRDATSIRDLLRSVEVMAFCAAVVLALGIALASSWLAESWLQAEGISVKTLRQAIAIMGMVIAIRFIEGIYRGCLIGLQRQVAFNVISSAMATIRGLGAVAILAWVSPTIQAYFVWQGLVSLMTLAVLGGTTYRSLPRAGRGGRFSLGTLREVWRFAGGMVGITVLSLLLTQVDKVLLSRLLTLHDFGHYSLAATAAGIVFTFAMPIVQAWYPQFNRILLKEKDSINASFHQAAQLVCVIAGSVSIVILVFADIIVRIWMIDQAVSETLTPILRLLILGNLLNALMWVPYRAQLAYGWTDLSVKINFVAALLFIPALIWITPLYGGTGAALAWTFLNTGYVLISAQFMYRRILSTEKWKWYAHDVFFPLLGASVAALSARQVLPFGHSTTYQLIALGGASVVTVGAAAIGASLIRERIFVVASQLRLSR